ncbi:MAG: sensor histidine kinase, partial [Aggregatilineales bacterium]
RLAEQVVTYTELTSGFAQKQLDAFGERVPIIEIVENAIAAAYPDLRAHNTQIETTYEISDKVEVRGLPRLLTMAVHEIIRNAITFSPPSGVIRLRASLEEPFVKLVIADQGCGIEESALESVWEIMAQSERQRREQQGVGMGLPIVRQIMRLHGGEASLESHVGQGTTVTLRLPISP